MNGAGRDPLTRAAAAYLEQCRRPLPIDEFLARHDDLREWLEPMLAAGGEQEAHSTRLGPFRLHREIGRGGMGVVHEATRDGDGEPIALKVLSGFLALQPARAERFRREATLAARQRHPGLVHVTDTGAVGDTLYLAMEFVAGAPLDAVIDELAGRDPATLTAADLAAAVSARQHRPSGHAPTPATFSGSYTAAIVAVAIELAEALAHLHRAGILHRDIKPSNVLLRPDGRVVLTDFGLARDVQDAALTVTGDFAGTPNYVSPEQSMAKRVAVDQRSDLFSFGSTLYELLTLQRAFPGDSMPEVLARIIGKEPTAPERLHRGLSPDLTTVLAKLLEKDPDRRYADADAVARDLRAFLEYRPVSARRASTWTRTLRWVRREPLRAMMAVVLIVGAATLSVGAGYLIARGDEIRAGRQQLRADRVNDLVDVGFVAAALEQPGEACARFEEALTIDGSSEEAGLGLLLTVLRRDGAVAARELLDARFAATLPPRLQAPLRFALLHRAREAGAAQLEAELREPQGAFALFLAAALGGDSNTPKEHDLELIERAVLACDRPRLWLHVEWAVSADLAGDAASCRRCAGSLQTNWPDSPVGVYFTCLALRRHEPRHALQLIRDARAKLPNEGRLDWAEGTVLDGLGDKGAALAAMERAVERLPQAPAATYTLARLRYEHGDYAAALPLMQRALELSPKFVEAWIGMGATLRHLGRADDALAALRQAIALHDSHAEAHFQLGQTLQQTNPGEEALHHLRRAATLSKSDPNKWHHVAFALFTGGDDAGGADALRRAIEVAPQYERGHLVHWMFLEERGTPEEQRAALVAWTRALPDSTQAWLRYGRHCLRADLGEGLQDAVAAAWAGRRALAVTGEASGEAWLLLAEAQTALGQAGAAGTSCDRALAATTALSAADEQRCRQLLARLGTRR